MKIIISPSKTQQITLNSDFTGSEPIFPKQSAQINNHLKAFSLDELKSIYKASDKVVEGAYKNIHSYNTSDKGQAIFSYTGAVFKEMKASEFTKDDMNFLCSHLLILSAHYGILEPLNLISPYRLDYNMKVPNINLKNLWKDKINDYLKGNIIINLASSEFSSIIDLPMLNVEFKELRGGKYKVIGTYAKMARGKMVNMIVKEKITDMNVLKKLSINGYTFNNDLSDENNFIYTK